MRYLRPGTIAAAGMLLFIGGLIYSIVFAGIPYQDPTPQMYATWKLHHRVGDLVILAGLVVLAGSLLWALARWIALARR
jgi:hypothetical protein